MADADEIVDGVFIPARKALGDLTNRTGKRPFSFISGKTNDRNDNIDNGDSQFTKQVCLGVENFVRQKCDAALCLNRNDKVVASLHSQNRKEGLALCSSTNLPSGNSIICNDALRLKNDLFDPTDSRMVTHNAETATKDGHESRDPNASSVSMPALAELVNTATKSTSGGTSGLSQLADRPLSEMLVTIADGNNDGDHNLSKLDTSGSGAMGRSQRLGSQASKFPALERCTGLKTGRNTDELHDVGLGFCSCSFCLKAAHIWMDLHYQDIRGRITAMKKSQKEANAMVLKLSKGMEALKNCQKNSKELSKLEFNLMEQWRSLFLHMEKVLAHESNQLEGSSHTLKDLRDNCKMDLEMINK